MTNEFKCCAGSLLLLSTNSLLVLFVMGKYRFGSSIVGFSLCLLSMLLMQVVFSLFRLLMLLSGSGTGFRAALSLFA